MKVKQQSERKPLVRMHVRVPEGLRADIIAIARAEQKSQSVVLRQALEAYCASYKAERGDVNGEG